MSVRESLNKAAVLLKEAKSVAVLTGAGISKESGIPTFREAQSGLWANYEPEKLATVDGFLRDPSLVWSWYEWRREMVSNVEPNAGHSALVKLEAMIPSFTVVTQNVDGLHAKAGSKSIIELHGNISRHKCLDKNHPVSDIPAGLKSPPTCRCGSLVRPDVVWFGEGLDPRHLDNANRAAKGAEVFLIIGTSGLVQPAASLPFVAKRVGAKLVECNPERTPLTNDVDIFIQGPSGKTLPELVRLMQ